MNDSQVVYQRPSCQLRNKNCGKKLHLCNVVKCFTCIVPHTAVLVSKWLKNRRNYFLTQHIPKYNESHVIECEKQTLKAKTLEPEASNMIRRKIRKTHSTIVKNNYGDKRFTFRCWAASDARPTVAAANPIRPPCSPKDTQISNWVSRWWCLASGLVGVNKNHNMSPWRQWTAIC